MTLGPRVDGPACHITHWNDFCLLSQNPLTENLLWLVHNKIDNFFKTSWTKTSKLTLDSATKTFALSPDAWNIKKTGPKIRVNKNWNWRIYK